LIIGGVELAPIYSELNDPEEQRRRFEQQARARAAGAEEAALPDEEFVEALRYGMPPAGGFGLGIDRLLGLLLGAHSIREVILFPILKPS
jgi:lysyl-tRNA synthetase, class II